MVEIEDKDKNCIIRKGSQLENEPVVIFIDYKDNDYEKRYLEERDKFQQQVEIYGIKKYIIYYADVNSNLTLIHEEILKLKPLAVVPISKSFNKMCPNTTRKLNYIMDYPAFRYTDDGLHVTQIPTITIPSYWTVLLHEYDKENFKLFDTGMRLVAALYKKMEEYYKTSIPKIESLKLEKSTTTDQKRISDINIELDKLERSCNISTLQTQLCGVEDIDAESEIILSYDQFKDFCKREIEGHNEVAFDVETNALETMDVNHKIVGFSLATGGTSGCYVPFESIDFNMNEKDKELIEKDLVEILKEKDDYASQHMDDEQFRTCGVWVYNCQHELPVVYNHYNMFLKSIKDLYVIVKLLNCGKKWGDGNRTLKYQVSTKLNKKSWDEDLDLYFLLFKKLNKEENVLNMKLLLSKYYRPDEIDDIMNKVIERYEELKENGEISEKVVLSYGHVPYKLIGRYGSLDSSSLFLLRGHYYQEMDDKNEIHNKDKDLTKERKFDLYEGFKLWQKVHIAHVIMEMNGFYFNDKKAEKLNIWINERVLDIMNYFVTSDLVREWIKYKSFMYDFSHDILMMDYVDDIIDNEKEAKVLPTKNAITKEHIKFYKPTKNFYQNIQYINNSVLYPYNLCSEAGINMDNDELIITHLANKNIRVTLEMVNCIKKLNKIYQTKVARYITTEFTIKDGFIIKLDWQHLLIIFLLFSSLNEEKDGKTLVDTEYDKWLELKLGEAKTFEDYKELFNVNSTTKDFRNYISDILLNEKIKLGHTYYKLYELYESPEFGDLKEQLSERTSTIAKQQLQLLEDFEAVIEKTTDSEVFSAERLEHFEKLYNKLDIRFIKSEYMNRKLKECFEWVRDSKYKLDSLDSITMEQLTQLYGMTGCNVDDRTTWTKEFEFMFNYKLIKKLLKAKTTYIYGSTSRASARYIDKYYYKRGELFPRRLREYENDSDLNRVYDLDKAIQVELEDGSTKTFQPDEEVQLSNGETKLAKDLTTDDDIILSSHLDNIESDEEDEEVDIID